jgi:hypothetical protein
MQVMNQKQVPLALPVDEAMVQGKALELFDRSRFLRGKYKRLEQLLADPVAGRCLRLCATQLVRLGSETQGR